MREIPMALSTSSSSSQQNANNTSSYDSKQGPSTLMNEISTLRSRLQELNDGDSPMNRPRSHSALMDGGRREPPMGGESALVNQLRKDLVKMEQEKAELELTLMNQMSKLAFENQATVETLHTRLAQSEKKVETLQQQRQHQQPQTALSSSLELVRIRKNLNDERGMRRALEEERDARHQEVSKLKEEREACEKENATMKVDLNQMQQKMNVLQSSQTKLQAERDGAIQEVQSLQSQLDRASQEQAKKESEHKVAVVNAERSFQGQMQEMKQSYQQRCSQLENEMAQKFDTTRSGVAELHSKILELESENENLVHSVADMQSKLDQEQAVNTEMAQALEEQREQSDQLFASLEESRKRCVMLEQELLKKFKTSPDQTDAKNENEALSKQITAIQQQVVAEQDKVSKMKTALDSERTTNYKLRLSLRQHQQRYEELNRNIRKNQSGLGLKTGNVFAIDKERKNLATQISQLQGQLSKERAKTKTLEESVSEQQKTMQQNMESTAGRRQTDTAALESAQLELQSVLNSYQSDVAALERKVLTSEQQLAERNRQNQRLEVEINEERRIRKSLAAQLTQAKKGVSSPSSSRSLGSQATGAEVTRLQKENARLSDELKLRARGSGQIDPAEVEFLRKQNRMLANGLNSEQVKELETLRERTKDLNIELDELRAKASGPSSGRNSPRVFLQNDLKAELANLKKQNAALSNELTAVKQQSASVKEKSTNLSKLDSGAPPPSPPRRMSRSSSLKAAPPSPKAKTDLFSSGMQTPPLSPPLLRMKKHSQPGSLRTPARGITESPVRGIVESFERRISRSNSCSSFTSAAEAAQTQLQSEAMRSQGQHLLSNANPPSASLANQAQEAQSSEVDDIRRELHEERATVQDLQMRLKAESGLIENLRRELSLLEAGDTKRKQMERTLELRNQDIARLQSKAAELEKSAQEAGDLREALEQYRATVTDLQTKLSAETELVVNLSNEVSKMEQTEAKRAALERSLKEREAEVQRLRSQVNDLGRMELEMRNTQRVMQQEKSTGEQLLNQLGAEKCLVTSLRKQLATAEEKLEKETTALQSLQSDLKTQSERVASLQQELADTEAKFEQEKSTVEDLRSNLSAETELAAAQRSAMQESEAMRAEGEKALGEREQELQRLSSCLNTESALVAELRKELCKLAETEGMRVKGEEELRKSEEELASARSKIGELEMLLLSKPTIDEGKLEKLQGELVQADAARKAFENKLFEDRAEMEKLKAEKTAIVDKLQASHVAVQKLEEEVSAGKASKAKLIQTKREDEDLIERLQTELGAARMGLERSLDELERKNNSQGQERATSQRDQEEIQRLKADLMVAKQALDINVEEMDKLQRCVKDADASRMITVRQSMSSQQEGQQKVESLKAELGKEVESSTRLRDQVAALQQELEKALAHVEELKALVSHLQVAHDSQLQHAQNSEKRTNKSIGAEMNTLKVELTKNQISRADMEMEYTHKIHSLESKIDGMQLETDKKMRVKESQLGQLKLQLSHKEEEIRQLEKERLQICSSMNNISSSRKDEMDELQEEVMSLTSKTGEQARSIQMLEMKLEEHNYRRSEFERLNERIEELEQELDSIPRRRSSEINPSDVEILKRENKLLREQLRDLALERRTLQEKLEALLSEKSTSKSTTILRERNAALKKEVERLTKRLKKMESSMTRFAI